MMHQTELLFCNQLKDHVFLSLQKRKRRCFSMEVIFIVMVGIVVLIIFAASIIFMLSNRSKDSKKALKQEIKRLDLQVKELENPSK